MEELPQSRNGTDRAPVCLNEAHETGRPREDHLKGISSNQRLDFLVSLKVFFYQLNPAGAQHTSVEKTSDRWKRGSLLRVWVRQGVIKGERESPRMGFSISQERLSSVACGVLTHS
ncbi:hypothetical protein Q8A67_018022 [Cirrhinus molitorella]|uniref:Uncharacterized protein n=1 Tax=Cirrhinus molitorella TaxID=172907 RepID=A0AA88TIK6_9TELE|nr:hypothetical protein Q8A67_018022 [Cirrhinus molitorella]